jgi:hypothetical protein
VTREGVELVATALAGGVALALLVYCVWWFRRH